MIKQSKQPLPKLITGEESLCDYRIKHGFIETLALGNIGRGTKAHILTIYYRTLEDGVQVCNVVSYCGSQKNYSNLSLISMDKEDLQVCDCDKCNRKYFITLATQMFKKE